MKAAYKSAIRDAQRAPKQAAWNRLHGAMVNSDTYGFWNSWKNLYSKNKTQCATVVNGCSSKEGIADEFRKSFLGNSKPNNQNKVDLLNSRFQVKYQEYRENHARDCNCNNYVVTLQNVLDAIYGMKAGKSADADGFSAEHLHNAPMVLLIRLQRLFNHMLRHGFVPKQFRFGSMIPIVKDSQGNHGDVSNYRGITISPIISKGFEHVLKMLFAENIATSPSQFGFKKNSSTVHALYCLKETVSYFIENKSRVFCSFLDASKAFDRLVHAGLFLKLMERKVPLVFLEIIMTWHDGLFCRVKWDGHYSEWFRISAGVRQGGVLSPDLYSLYIDDLITILKSLGIGCYVRGIFAASLFYADDMAVLAPSIKGLQKLLDACNSYCEVWDIKLNEKKTKNICFGIGSTPTHSLSLNGSIIPWENQCVYLGMMLKSGPVFSCSMKETLGKFYRCLNSIIRIEGRSDDKVMLRLLEAHCLPILAYAIEVVHVTDRDDKRQLRVAYNSIYRKIFDFNYRESVTLLQHSLGRLTWEEYCAKRILSFSIRRGQSPPGSLLNAFD